MVFYYELKFAHSQCDYKAHLIQCMKRHNMFMISTKLKISVELFVVVSNQGKTNTNNVFACN